MGVQNFFSLRCFVASMERVSFFSSFGGKPGPPPTREKVSPLPPIRMAGPLLSYEFFCFRHLMSLQSKTQLARISFPHPRRSPPDHDRLLGVKSPPEAGFFKGSFSWFYDPPKGGPFSSPELFHLFLGCCKSVPWSLFFFFLLRFLTEPPEAGDILAFLWSCFFPTLQLHFSLFRCPRTNLSFPPPSQILLFFRGFMCFR